MAKVPKPKRSPIERLVDRVTGARLCFGEPVQVGAQTVIPVARVRVFGGWGYGNQDAASDSAAGAGGGGGGHLDAQPVGFISVRSDGATYEAIPDPERSQKLLKAAVGGAATLVAAVAGAKRLRDRRRPSRLLSR
jgi:uncharacterized spore protein YtfJ